MDIWGGPWGPSGSWSPYQEALAKARAIYDARIRQNLARIERRAPITCDDVLDAHEALAHLRDFSGLA